MAFIDNHKLRPPCCQRHTLNPEKVGTTACGPLEDADLERMFIRIQRVIDDLGPGALRSGSGERALLALIPEVLMLRSLRRPESAPDRCPVTVRLHDGDGGEVRCTKNVHGDDHDFPSVAETGARQEAPSR